MITCLITSHSAKYVKKYVTQVGSLDILPTTPVVLNMRYALNSGKFIFDDDMFFSDYLLNKIQEKTQQSFTLERVYANGHTYGLDGIFHQDSFDENGRTFLLHANLDWKNSWGGGTHFYNDTDELRTVMFQPNRGILFPGRVFHSAAPITRLCNELRITVNWKLQKNG